MAVWLTSHLTWLRTDPTGPATADRIRRDAVSDFDKASWLASNSPAARISRMPKVG